MARRPVGRRARLWSEGRLEQSPRARGGSWWRGAGGRRLRVDRWGGGAAAPTHAEGRATRGSLGGLRGRARGLYTRKQEATGSQRAAQGQK